MLPHDTLLKLAKLLPLLASDKDGEVFAAVRAIDRALAAAGSDFHGLVRHMTERPSARDTAMKKAGGASDSPYGFNYADHFEEAAPVSTVSGYGDALTGRFGLRIDGSGYVASWREIAIHCLKLNRTVQRKHGGRFLRDFEVALLDQVREGKRWPTNTQVAWIEIVIARCHQARDAAARAGQGGGDARPS